MPSADGLLTVGIGSAILGLIENDKQIRRGLKRGQKARPAAWAVTLNQHML